MPLVTPRRLMLKTDHDRVCDCLGTFDTIGRIAVDDIASPEARLAFIAAITAKMCDSLKNDIVNPQVIEDPAEA